MTAPSLQAHIDRHLAHAVASRDIEEALGTWHGLGWSQFVLLDQLEAAGGKAETLALAARLGLAASQLVAQLLPMEKTGWVQRQATAAPDGVRRVSCVQLRPAGRRLLLEARETAAGVCPPVH